MTGLPVHNHPSNPDSDWNSHTTAYHLRHKNLRFVFIVLIGVGFVVGFNSSQPPQQLAIFSINTLSKIVIGIFEQFTWWKLFPLMPHSCVTQNCLVFRLELKGIIFPRGRSMSMHISNVLSERHGCIVFPRPSVTIHRHHHRRPLPLLVVPIHHCGNALRCPVGHRRPGGDEFSETRLDDILPPSLEARQPEPRRDRTIHVAHSHIP